MSELIGAPVTAVARVNVIWLDTLRGFWVLVVVIVSVKHLLGTSPSNFDVTMMVGTWGLVCLAWVGLRKLGGPLRLGLIGGLAAVSGTTLYIAAAHWITGKPTKVLGSWPRDAVVLTRMSRIGLRRLLTVKFPGTD